jgi:CheY-like chemotaxis protein
MNPSPRPPPSVLFIHNGAPYAAHMDYLIKSGLHVSDIDADAAIETASSRQPDIIVLDFAVDGDLMERLKAHEKIRHIPVIALVDLIRPD